MNRPIICVDSISGCTLKREKTRPDSDVCPDEWVARDEEAIIVARLPGFLTEIQASEILLLIKAHEKHAHEFGECAGALAERDKITYGFRAVLSPLLEQLQSTISEEAREIRDTVRNG